MKSLIFVSILILNVFTAYSEIEPVMKIYMNDGSSKLYKINDIDDLSFISSNLSYSMSVFQSNGNSISDFDIRTIDSIEFENNQTMTIIQPGSNRTFYIAEIDSIIFKFNTCEEIQINEQIWKCRNLDVDHYRNGDIIPEVRDSATWANMKTGAWCYYNNDPKMGEIYGKLYNCYAVYDPRGLAPTGWHIPWDSEWRLMASFLGGDDVAGGKMKESGTEHWEKPNTGATNESGFTALPGGYRGCKEGFLNNGVVGDWWTNTQYIDYTTWETSLVFFESKVRRCFYDNAYGLSVRCVKDK